MDTSKVEKLLDSKLLYSIKEWFMHYFSEFCNITNPDLIYFNSIPLGSTGFQIHVISNFGSPPVNFAKITTSHDGRGMLIDSVTIDVKLLRIMQDKLPKLPKFVQEPDVIALGIEKHSRSNAQVWYSAVSALVDSYNSITSGTETSMQKVHDAIKLDDVYSLLSFLHHLKDSSNVQQNKVSQMQ